MLSSSLLWVLLVLLLLKGKTVVEVFMKEEALLLTTAEALLGKLIVAPRAGKAKNAERRHFWIEQGMYDESHETRIIIKEQWEETALWLLLDLTMHYHRIYDGASGSENQKLQPINLLFRHLPAQT